MNSTIVRYLAGAWVVLFLGCGGGSDEEPEPEPEVYVTPGDYESETYNLLTNTCGSSDNPLAAIRIEAGADQNSLTFPDLVIGGEFVPTAAATAMDGVFTLKLSVPLTIFAYDEVAEESVDCLLNDSLEISVSVIDSESLSIDMGELRLDPVAGPAALCTEAVRSDLSVSGYDHGEGCSVTFTSTMKQVYDF